MYEDTIETILGKDQVAGSLFLGAVARDELRSVKIRYPSCLIVNNEPRSQPGGHWLAIYYSKDKRAYFFDSYGNDPAFYRLQDFIQDTSSSWEYNKQRIQGLSEFCGLYSILFLLYKTRNNEREFFSQFKKTNYDFNDRLIKSLL
jgi:hypothetical protein